MMPNPLHYYRPDTITEARDLFEQLQHANQRPTYYGGGTEILTRSRLNDGDFDAVIDLKGIPELHVHEQDGSRLRFGSVLRLTELADRDLWPFLTATVDRIADHTTRGQITLGGNLFSTLPYKEALLPFLVSDSADLTVATPDGVKQRRLADVFDEELRLDPGDFLISVTVDGQEAKALAFKSFKMTRQDWIDYPLVTIGTARREDGSIRAAFSGWSSFPFTSSRVNKILSNTQKPPEERAREAVAAMPFHAVDDIHGSSEYRQFVTQYTLARMLKELEAQS